MEYLSAKEAAAKWQVSIRIVQQYCKDNRIPGARKYGVSWMIPSKAEKPKDPRKVRKQYIDGPKETYYTTISLPKKDPNKGLLVLEGEIKNLAIADFEYRRGNSLPAVQLWEKTPEDSDIKLSAASLATVAAIGSGDYTLYDKIRMSLNHKKENAKTAQDMALLSLPETLAAVSMAVPEMTPEWLKTCDFSLFSLELRPFLLYLHCLHLRNIGDYSGMLAMAQTTLLLCESRDTFTWLDVYLNILCGSAAYELGKSAESLKYLSVAADLGLPSGFIAPFADYTGNLGGTVETVLYKNYSDMIKPVHRLWNRSFKNWVRFHNSFAKENITTLLKPQEYQVAYLLAHGGTYVEIAARMHLSVSRIKNILSKVYSVLCIQSKQELAELIL